jgi:hypothetical protein
VHCCVAVGRLYLSPLQAPQDEAAAPATANQWYTARMATKKKSKKKQTKSKRSAGKKLAKKRVASKKSLAKWKLQPKKQAGAKRKAGAKPARAPKKPVRGKSQTVYTVDSAREGLEPRSGGQSGDLQGLSSLQGADSESVDELLEEGNAFEAEVVKGVQDAGDADEGEVRTHEVREDDVPGEYLDKE